MMPRQIFLVESDRKAAAAIARVLANGDYSVTVVGSFEEVTAFAVKRRPDLLITAVRLGRFNGLHLAARFRADYPGLPIIVLGEENEVGLAAEAIRLQARFVPRSTPPAQLMEFIDHLIAGRTPKDLVSTRRWPRRHAALPAQVADATGWVIDVGYGGLRLACKSQPAADVPVDVSLPTVGMCVRGIFRWSRRADDDTAWWCGLELDTMATDARKWRRVVDSLPQA